MLSYWETSFLKGRWDLVIVGAGFSGMATALHSLIHNPKLKILLIEKESFGRLASSKNAGFACYGSLSEFCSDISQMGLDKSLELMAMRRLGIEGWRNLFGNRINFEPVGGLELFNNSEHFLKFSERLNEVNKLVKSAGFQYHEQAQNQFPGFYNKAIFSADEAVLNPMLLLKSLEKELTNRGCEFLFGTRAEFNERDELLLAIGDEKIKLNYHALALTTNALFHKSSDLKPARAQVLISKEFDFKWRGSFHAEEGYYYWRHVGKRLLLGGARHLDSDSEEVAELGLNQKLQDHLEKEFLPKITGKKVGIEQRWSGIMAMGTNKWPEIGYLTPRTVYGVKLGGMGVALSYQIGKILSDKLWK